MAAAAARASPSPNSFSVRYLAASLEDKLSEPWHVHILQVVRPVNVANIKIKCLPLLINHP